MVLFFAGFVLSLFGSLPPGLISLSVAQTAIARNLRAAMQLAVGAAFAEFFQAWVAVAMADWFLQHPIVERYFQWAAIPVFWGLALYLFFWAKAPQKTNSVRAGSSIGQIGKGILISVFNLLAIPYWFTYCGWLKVSGWWVKEGVFESIIFSAGVAIGTLFALGLYARLGQEIVHRSDMMARYANRFVALIFFGLGLRLLWGLVIHPAH